MANSVVLDNGAYSLKVGLASDQEPRVIPNCITRQVMQAALLSNTVDNDIGNEKLINLSSPLHHQIKD